MGYTKRQFVEAALEELGIASYAFDLQPEQLESAMRRLDSMMAQWNALGIHVGYPLVSSPEDADLDTESGVPDRANDAIITNLALRLAPSYGKAASAITMTAAKLGYNTLLARAAHPIEKQMPAGVPLGAGNKLNAADGNTTGDPDIRIDAILGGAELEI